MAKLRTDGIMPAHMLIFGLGYTASYLAKALRADGWQVTGIKREASESVIAFNDSDSVFSALKSATHVLSSVPPVAGQGDPVLLRYGAAITDAPALWSGYLSSTGVYGDTKGAWVDESAPLGGGRRSARTQADLDWQTLRGDMRVFRLPGIYGPNRSTLDRVAQGKAHRIDLPQQIFSRVHVADIVSGVCASFDGPPGVYNLADDWPCSQNAVIEAASALLHVAPPPLLTIADAGLSPAARAFYAENRRVANGKAKRLLGWTPLYPTYQQGLRAIQADSQTI
jgi:nucleoside-diphosphate-sugar epimerase